MQCPIDMQITNSVNNVAKWMLLFGDLFSGNFVAEQQHSKKSKEFLLF